MADRRDRPRVARDGGAQILARSRPGRAAARSRSGAPVASAIASAVWRARMSGLASTRTGGSGSSGELLAERARLLPALPGQLAQLVRARRAPPSLSAQIDAHGAEDSRGLADGPRGKEEGQTHPASSVGNAKQQSGRRPGSVGRLFDGSAHNGGRVRCTPLRDAPARRVSATAPQLTGLPIPPTHPLAPRTVRAPSGSARTTNARHDPIPPCVRPGGVAGRCPRCARRALLGATARGSSSTKPCSASRSSCPLTVSGRLVERPRERTVRGGPTPLQAVEDPPGERLGQDAEGARLLREVPRRRSHRQAYELAELDQRRRPCAAELPLDAIEHGLELAERLDPLPNDGEVAAESFGRDRPPARRRASTGSAPATGRAAERDNSRRAARHPPCGTGGSRTRFARPAPTGRPPRSGAVSEPSGPSLSRDLRSAACRSHDERRP